MLSSQEEQAERRRVMQNDARVREQSEEERRRTFAPNQSLPNQASTFYQHAQADAATPRGRFSAVTAATVVGATAVTNYPAAASHQRDPVGQEPSLGYRTDELEPSMAFVEAQDGGPAAAPLVSKRAGPSLSQAGDPTSEALTRISHASGPVGSPVRRF
jgi:hypothetical protein